MTVSAESQPGHKAIVLRGIVGTPAVVDYVRIRFDREHLDELHGVLNCVVLEKDCGEWERIEQ